MRLYRRHWAAAAVFALTGLWLYWLDARRFVLSSDEGIFVDGARRILSGQVPYRDFFILMGPGTFWLQALALRVFGMTLAASRAVMILDVSMVTACVFWLVSRISVAYAAWTAAVVMILETADPGIALPNHRWDSAALATLAIAICAGQPRRWTLFFAGCCAAFAAWITPPVALAGLTVAVCLWMETTAPLRSRLGINASEPRALASGSRLWLFLAGCAAVTLCSAAALAMRGALIPMIRQIVWTGSNYSGANHMPYGSRFGGYAQMFAGAGKSEIVARGFVVLGLSLPAILPPLIALLFWRPLKAPPLRMLFLGGVALIASTYPRMDVPHLTYTAPLFYALTAILAAPVLRPMARVATFAVCTLLASIFTWYGVTQHFSETTLETNVGSIRASPDDAVFLRGVQLEIPRGSSLFVFPYLPIAHFLTLDRNPTRYSYLQPGMMSDEDESTAIAELKRNPPSKVLYFDLPEPEILRIWPSSDPSRVRLRRMEAYLSSNYHKLRAIDCRAGSFEILEPNRQALTAGAITDNPASAHAAPPAGIANAALVRSAINQARVIDEPTAIATHRSGHRVRVHAAWTAGANAGATIRSTR